MKVKIKDIYVDYDKPEPRQSVYPSGPVFQDKATPKMRGKPTSQMSYTELHVTGAAYHDDTRNVGNEGRRVFSPPRQAQPVVTTTTGTPLANRLLLLVLILVLVFICVIPAAQIIMGAK